MSLLDCVVEMDGRIDRDECTVQQFHLCILQWLTMQYVFAGNEDVPDTGGNHRNGMVSMRHDGTSLNSNASSSASSRTANMADMCLIHSSVKGKSMEMGTMQMGTMNA